MPCSGGHSFAVDRFWQPTGAEISAGSDVQSSGEWMATTPGRDGAQSPDLSVRIRSSEACSVAFGIVPAWAWPSRYWNVFAVDPSDPVSMIMSVPARQAREASVEGDSPYAVDVPVSESVMVTPV